MNEFNMNNNRPTSTQQKPTIEHTGAVATQVEDSSTAAATAPSSSEGPNANNSTWSSWLKSGGEAISSSPTGKKTGSNMFGGTGHDVVVVSVQKESDTQTFGIAFQNSAFVERASTMKQQQQQQQQPIVQEEDAELGMVTSSMPPGVESRMVAVTKVQPNSPFLGKLTPGMEILQINHTPCAGLQPQDIGGLIKGTSNGSMITIVSREPTRHSLIGADAIATKGGDDTIP